MAEQEIAKFQRQLDRTGHSYVIVDGDAWEAIGRELLFNVQRTQSGYDFLCQRRNLPPYDEQRERQLQNLSHAAYAFLMWYRQHERSKY